MNKIIAQYKDNFGNEAHIEYSKTGIESMPNAYFAITKSEGFMSSENFEEVEKWLMKEGYHKIKEGE